MVDAMAGQEAPLDPDDYLWPLTTIRDTLESPGATLPSPKLRSILTYHLDRLKSPWKRAKSGSKDGPNALTQTSISPIPGVQISIDEDVKRLAGTLAEEAGISGTDSCLISKSYITYASNGAPSEEKLLFWYSEECLALAQIVVVVLRLSREDREDEWTGLANDVREGMMPDPAEYMENLFRGWAGLAQKPLEGSQRGPHALFWSTHQLRLQTLLLDILFLTLYQTPERPAQTSQGLVRGFLMSSFGTAQANREFWDSDPEAIRLSTQIRDLSLIIALESLCLSSIVTPGEDDIQPTSLLRSKEAIISLHLFINDQSADLSPGKDTSSEAGTTVVDWPISVVCLAWAVVLHSLPPGLQPSSAGYSGEVHQETISRALNADSNMFPWMEEVLAGPAVNRNRGQSGQSETYRRKTFKDVLIGLSELLPLDRIPDRSGLYRVWDLVFGSGSPSTSLAMAADYWVADYPSHHRRAILDHSAFPHYPVHLPNILTALAGISSPEQKKAEIFDILPVKLAAEYFSNLTQITFPVDPSWCNFIGKDEDGRSILESARDVRLPGGIGVHAGCRGTVVGQTDAKQVVSWEISSAGWGILVEALRTAAGLRGIDDRYNGETVSIRDLGIQGGASDVLAAGLGWLASAIKPISGIGKEVIALIPTSSGMTPPLLLLELAIAVLHQYTATDHPSGTDTAAVISSLDIIGSLAHHYPSITSTALRTSGFFGLHSKKRGLIGLLVQIDSGRGQHGITTALLRLADILVDVTSNSTFEDAVLTVALQRVYSDIWATYSGWRYADLAKRYELSDWLATVLDKVIAHPLDKDSKASLSAQALLDTFITGASVVTYRPILEILSSAPAVIQRARDTYRADESRLVESSVNSTARLLATLLRSARTLGVYAATLPISLFSTNITLNTSKVSLADGLCTLSASSSSESNRIATLKLVRTYLLSTSDSAQKPSFVSLLHDPARTCSDLATLAAEDAPLDQQAAAWDLLSAIVSTQPGCAPFVIGSSNGFAPPLEQAINRVINRDDLHDAPHVLSALLAFCHSVITAPVSHSILPKLRENKAFWTSIFAAATTPVPTPPSFALSLHAPDFAIRIVAYAHATQARARAISVLAAELELLQGQNDHDPKSPALDAVLGLYRSGDKLSELTGVCVKNGCLPELHVSEAQRVATVGVCLPKWRGSRLPGEREFGLKYLYTGNLRTEALHQQSLVNFAVDSLNLNWTVTDADMALTSAFRILTDSVLHWTEGDAIAAKAALRAALAVAEMAADEERSGEVMLAVQTERVNILASLIDCAMGDGIEADVNLVVVIVPLVRRVVDSNEFPPIESLRHTDLPPIHQPTLRILETLFRHLSTIPGIPAAEALVESGGTFVITAADIVLDGIQRGSSTPVDLALTMAPLCEMIKIDTNIWLDKLSESNLIIRSLDLINRMRIKDDTVPAYISSILMFHLALANHPRAAEKLAVSGLFPTYADNAVASEAEYGGINVGSKAEASAHSTWCAMLLVIRTLLTSLPLAGNFTISDVLPFIRLTTAQHTKALAWDPDTPWSIPVMDEVSISSELFFAISSAIGANTALLADFSSPAFGFLTSVRYALNHPRLFSTHILPSDTEEQAILLKELELVDGQQEVLLVDFAKTPVLADRVARMIRTARSVFLALIGFSGSWDLMTGMREVSEGLEIRSGEEVSSASLDPIGVFNDFQSLMNVLCEQISTATDEGTELLRISQQLSESAALLSASQILVRKSLFNPDSRDEDTPMEMDEKPRRVSLGNTGAAGGGGEGSGYLREFEEDWRGIQEGQSVTGERRFLRWLEECLDRAFEDEGGAE